MDGVKDEFMSDKARFKYLNDAHFHMIVDHLAFSIKKGTITKADIPDIFECVQRLTRV